mmetsp:Transcript_16901/g.34875  ORF Transcript_16901/g.34875 Transcript_16901/m.34875 type:complete len:281 (-) Transcript_16901:31-873(-)
MIFVQINVPARSPGNLGMLPVDVVRKDNDLVGCDNLRILNVFGQKVLSLAGARAQLLFLALVTLAIPLVSSRKGVLDTEGFDREANHTIIVRAGIKLVVINVDIDVVVDVGLFLVHESNGKTTGIVQQFVSRVLAPQNVGGRHVVNDPVVVVSVLDVLEQSLGIVRTDGFRADLFAVHLFQHVDNIGRRLDFVARQEFAQILAGHFRAVLGLAKGHSVIILGNLGVNRCHGIDLHFDGGTLFEFLGLDARNVVGIDACKSQCHEKKKNETGHFAAATSRM